jgi:hypothetical protein
MKRTVLIFGLISGALIACWGLASVIWCNGVENYITDMLMGYGAQLLALSLVYVGVKNYRDKELGGFISFGKAFTLGLYISLVACTLYVIAWAIDYHFFIPDFMDKYTAQMISHAKASGASAAAIKAQIDSANSMKAQYQNPFWFTLYTYAEILPTGIIVSLISALVLKKKESSGSVALA